MLVAISVHKNEMVYEIDVTIECLRGTHWLHLVRYASVNSSSAHPPPRAKKNGQIPRGGDT